MYTSANYNYRFIFLFFIFSNNRVSLPLHYQFQTKIPFINAARYTVDSCSTLKPNLEAQRTFILRKWPVAFEDIVSHMTEGKRIKCM